MSKPPPFPNLQGPPGIKRKVPVHAIDWPPSRASVVIQLDTATDNWSTVAQRAGMAALDLIEFNFATRVAEEINWCMEKYLGCTEAAPDGKNLTFRRARNAFVFAPHALSARPADWVTPPSDWRGVIATMLRHASETLPAMTWYATCWAEARDFGVVSRAVRDGDIGVMRSRQLLATEHTEGLYNSEHNTLVFPRLVATGYESISTVIHESVHAIMDMKAITRTYLQDEVLCRVLSGVYMVRRFREPVTRALASGLAFANRADYEVGWFIDHISGHATLIDLDAMASAKADVPGRPGAHPIADLKRDVANAYTKRNLSPDMARAGDGIQGLMFWKSLQA